MQRSRPRYPHIGRIAEAMSNRRTFATRARPQEEQSDGTERARRMLAKQKPPVDAGEPT